MELKVGDKVRYIFPEPKNLKENEFVGTIEIITDNYIYLTNERNIRLKVTSKNFHLININANHFSHTHINSELFFG